MVWDWLWSERKRWAIRPHQASLKSYPTLPNFDPRSQELFGTALPRGVLLPRLQADRDRIRYWMSPSQLLTHRYHYGQIILGKLAQTFLGYLDDRMIITIAGSRAGKTSTVLLPNLFCYPGSIVANDPKGQLARTARFRRALGHKAYVLDPFGQSGEASSCFNPLNELDRDDWRVVDDVVALAYALIPDNGDAHSKHWTDSARALIVGLILLTLTLPESERHLVTVRELLCLSYGWLINLAQTTRASALANVPQGERKSYFDANSVGMDALLGAMVGAGNRFGGILAGIGTRFKETQDRERASIFSTASAPLDFIDSLPLRATLKHSDFTLADLRGDRPVAVFLCLPAAQMQRHAPWLKIFLQMAFTVFERLGEHPRHKPPVLFMMEEFNTLGHFSIMQDSAAAYLPNFGVQLWVVLQDITQLQRNYQGWETFMGNAGLIQMFANGDQETLTYAASRMEMLITPSELRTAFARERGSQLLLMEGQPPAAAMRLDHADVAKIQADMMGRA